MAYRITSECIGCTLCARNCPVHAISGKGKEQHQINQKRCVDCGVCGNVCPKGAVVDGKGNMPARIPKTRWKKPAIDQEACSACSMCVDICSFSCIAITYPAYPGDLSVYASLKSADLCVGCGLCAGICPLHAITMKGGEQDASAGIL